MQELDHVQTADKLKGYFSDLVLQHHKVGGHTRDQFKKEIMFKFQAADVLFLTLGSTFPVF